MNYNMININTHIHSSEKMRNIIDLGWGGLKDYIFPCLTSPEGICQIKEGLAYSNLLDLHIHYYIRAESGEGRKIKIIWIDQTFLTEWDIDLDRLQ